jgi:hypothetical protein
VSFTYNPIVFRLWLALLGHKLYCAHWSSIDLSCPVFSEIAKHLSLPPVKLHCSMLAEDAIKAAVKDYEAKKAKLDKGNE